jgi:hypothetical protein
MERQISNLVKAFSEKFSEVMQTSNADIEDAKTQYEIKMKENS